MKTQVELAPPDSSVFQMPSMGGVDSVYTPVPPSACTHDKWSNGLAPPQQADGASRRAAFSGL